MDQQPPPRVPAGASNIYVLGGRIILSAMFILLIFAIFFSACHLYFKWYFLRHRRRHRHRHNHGVEDGNQIASVTHGLDPEILKSLPCYEFSKEESKSSVVECAVCLSEFEEKETVRLLPKCTHSFHIECIDMWLHSHTTCPLCRSPVEPQTEPSHVAVEIGESDSNQESSSQEGDLCTCGTAETTNSSVVKSGGECSRAAKLTIQVGSRGQDLDLESNASQSQISPGSPFLYIKRLLSMNMRSPGGSHGAPSHVAGTSGTSAVDLEVQIRVQ